MVRRSLPRKTRLHPMMSLGRRPLKQRKTPLPQGMVRFYYVEREFGPFLQRDLQCAQPGCKVWYVAPAGSSAYCVEHRRR